MKTGIGDAVRRIEMNGDLGVTFDPGDRVNGDGARHGFLYHFIHPLYSPSS
jgi:hypothetical protein